MTNKTQPKISINHLTFRDLLKWALSKEGVMVITSLVAMISAITFRSLSANHLERISLLAALSISGCIIFVDLFKAVLEGEFSSDFLAGISIGTAIFLGEYWAAILVVFMLSGGQSLERFAMKNASAVLKALSERMPNIARRRESDGVREVSLSDINIGDIIELHPHDICPIDGVVIEGRSSMDEAFLTGEPYVMPKIEGSKVISGAINGEGLITIRATARANDSRYQKIATVIEQQATKQVPIRRIADSLARWYTPFGILVAIFAWILSNDPIRFLAVLVVATPCPLIIGIPICIIGAISSAARKGIIIRDPAALEVASTCTAMILDKTGTLTVGKPTVTKITYFCDWKENDLLPLLYSIERYSKHPLAKAILEMAESKGHTPFEVSSVTELPGTGLFGKVNGFNISIGKRDLLTNSGVVLVDPPSGPECGIVIDEKPVALIQFKDIPRRESRPFVEHLSASHGINRVMLLSGDRDTEAQYLASLVGISSAQGGLSPEDKLNILKDVLKKERTIFVGDGINDAPSLQAATVGIALGTASDIITESADIIILEPSLERVDSFFHLSHKVRQIALQTGIGGIALSVIGMIGAAFGFLPPVIGACVQEAIDLAAIINALRTTSRNMTDSDSLN